MLERAARATCDFYIHQASALDGICYWDTGAPQLHLLGDWKEKAADPVQRFRARRFIGKRNRRARPYAPRPSVWRCGPTYMQAGLASSNA